MSPIYDADTLRQITITAELANLAHLENDILPELVQLINDNNFSTANDRRRESETEFNLSLQKINTVRDIDIIDSLIKKTFRDLGFKVTTSINRGKYLTVCCSW